MPRVKHNDIEVKLFFPLSGVLIEVKFLVFSKEQSGSECSKCDPL